ncbi:hypothetical protein AXF42_Ash000632 [Apostasia shenzhenica]|uniref:Uncharacterized protein n=1 Tax=Apostasia shenzhenica TaxID=1088818 RepID=A0A2I0AGX0_9ASPA|nr:hypothetical protein AXF42_Ash000632 [Apostasia shenzhenica]
MDGLLILFDCFLHLALVDKSVFHLPESLRNLALISIEAQLICERYFLPSTPTLVPEDLLVSRTRFCVLWRRLVARTPLINREQQTKTLSQRWKRRRLKEKGETNYSLCHLHQLALQPSYYRS